MTIEFKTFDQYDPAESVTMLFYGPAGAGKTEAAGSYGDRTLYIDVGKSSETFHGIGYKQRKGQFKGIYVPISETEPTGKNSLVSTKATGFDKVCEVIDEAVEKIPDKFDIIVVDEATAFRRLALNKGIEINQSTGKSKSLESGLKYDMVIPAVQDYGAEMSLISQFVNYYTDYCKRINKHFLLIAHERHTYQKGEKIGDQSTLKRIAPGFTGQTFPDEVSNIFDLVWRFEVVNGTVYRANTRGNSLYMGKTRYSGIFNEFEFNVSIPDVLNRIKKQIPAKKT